jgi:hypothetical protein
VNERAFLKFRKHSGRWEKLGWTRTMRIHIGVRLLALLIESSGGWFEQVYESRRTKLGKRGMEARIKLSPVALAWIEARHDFHELQRPWLLPMLAPPLDWVEVTE